MSQNNRIFLAAVLSMLIVFGYSYFYAPKTTQNITTPASGLSKVESSMAQPSQNQNPALESTLSTTPPQDIAIESKDALITVNTKGAVITSYKLKNYKQTPDANAPLKDVLAETNESKAFGLDLGAQMSTDQDVYDIVSQNKNGDTTTLVLKLNKGPLVLTKTLIFGIADKPYAISVAYSVQNTGTSPWQVDPVIWSQLGQKPESESGFSVLKQPNLFEGIYQNQENRVAVPEFKKLTQNVSLNQNHAWSAITDRYFAVLTLPTSAQTFSSLVFENRQGTILYKGVSTGMKNLAPNETFTQSFWGYIGPKHQESLIPFRLSSNI